MSMTPDKISVLSEAKSALISAKASNAGISVAKERMKNLLFNYYDELVTSAIDCMRFKEEIESLEAALDESDMENENLRKEIKELKSVKDDSSCAQTKKSVKKE